MPVWIVAILCVAALVRLATLPDARAAAIVAALGVTPSRLLASPLSPAQLLTLAVSPFLHAGWIHLAGNLLYLLVFGPAVHERLGTRGFVALYLAGGVAGAVAHSLAHPASTAPLVGASGAIAAVLGAHLLLEPRAKVTTLVPVLVFFEVAALPAAFVIALWFALQLASAVAPVADVALPIAWYAHIGGFVLGLVGASLFVTSNAARIGSKHRRRPRGRRRNDKTRKRAA